MSRNIILDRNDEIEGQIEIAKMQGFYNNPEWFFRLNKEGEKGDGDLKFGSTEIHLKNDFDKRLQATIHGVDTRRDRPDIAARVKARREHNHSRGISTGPQADVEAQALMDEIDGPTEYTTGDDLEIIRKTD